MWNRPTSANAAVSEGLTRFFAVQRYHMIVSESARSRPDHLDDLPDGCGCAEVWEALSAVRAGSGERSADEED